MIGNMVNWRDYDGVAGFYGNSSYDQVNELNKALLVGSSINPPGSAVAGDGFALRVESLESTLKVTTYGMRHIRLWRALPKRPAYNTIEEFNQIHSYGNISGGMFFEEGGLPVEVDSTYERKHVPIKFMGVGGRVSHVATVVRPAHGNVIAQETIAKTMHLLRMLEENLFFADSDLDSFQFDGLEKLILDGASSDHIIDMRGAPLSEEKLIDGSLTIMAAESYGYPTHLFCSPEAKTDLVKGFFPKGRYDLFSKPDAGSIGLDVASFVSPAGDVALEHDVFLGAGALKHVAQVAAEGSIGTRPASPVISTALTSPASGSSQFIASDAGDYFWWVQAVNRFGSSAAVQVNGSAETMAAGDSATFGVSPGAGPLPSYYKVYRTKPDLAASTAQLIQRIPATAVEVVILDLNADMPGTTKAFLIQLDSSNLSFAQLAPMARIPLPPLDTSIRWIQILYGAMMMYTPNHNVIYKNIGRAADSVGVGA